VGCAVIYLLDTNICSYIINKRPPKVLARFEGLHYVEAAVSSITGAELAFGVANSGSARNRDALEKFLAPLELQAAGQPIGAIDTLIAAHALAVDAVLVTNNLAEFGRVPGLKSENWV
jgi:tRNA(fMet)-specific endonuclease VapC